MKTPTFLALCVLWVVIPSFHISYGPKGEKIVFEEMLDLTLKVSKMAEEVLPSMHSGGGSISESE